MRARLGRVSVSVAVVSFLLVGVATQRGVTAQAPTAANAITPDAARERAVLDQYCVGCHNQRLTSGGLRLDNLDIARIGERAEVGEKIVRKLRAGDDAAAGREAAGRGDDRVPVPASFEQRLDRAAALQADLRAAGTASPQPPRIRQRHLRSAASRGRPGQLPAGRRHQRRFRQYRQRAEHLAGAGRVRTCRPRRRSAASRSARKQPRRRRPTWRRRTCRRATRWTARPFGSRGGLLVRHYFPVDGIYAFNWTPVRSNAGGLHGDANGEQLRAERRR